MDAGRGWAATLWVTAWMAAAGGALAAPYEFPPAEETPEEVLRLEEPGYGNSAVSGERLSLGDYARLQSQLQEAQKTEPQISPQLQNLIFLLRIRKFLRTFVPFI
ncbi:hypothetical protein [Gloeobacter morelensis]|uniref:Uncharacterized protein n=1 Tax=Gloeobacter morelensis MG652769 TaxID=2781736 RepID=A0ABY3PPK1_9CYAN|nr:hypothetical protein [Gloeobacter morelensis]UFP95611.1 hypothetical protein ISF26_05035 [Gloeobacter morelensis MG652769]